MPGEHSRLKRAALIVAVFLLTNLICGGIEVMAALSLVPPPGPTAEALGLTQPPDAVAQLSIEGHLFRPNRLEVQAGKATALFISNKDSFDHSFDVDALNLHARVAPGKTVVVLVKLAAAGDIEFYCAIPGHRQMGMVGIITAK